MAEKQVERITTEEFRANFAYVFDPKDTQMGPRFAITMMFPKTQDNAALIPIRDLCYKVAAAKYGTNQDGSPAVPNNFVWPWKDGDTQTGRDGVRKCDKYPELAGCWVMEAKSQFKPGVVDYQVQPIISPNQFFSGCYARAQIHAYVYDNSGNVGCNIGLDNLQKTRDGESLVRSGGPDPASAFDAFQGGSNNAGFNNGQGQNGGQNFGGPNGGQDFNGGGQFNQNNYGGGDPFQGGQGGQANGGMGGQSNQNYNNGGGQPQQNYNNNYNNGGQDFNGGGQQFNNQNNMNGQGYNNQNNNGGGQFNNQNNQYNNQNNMNGGGQPNTAFP